MTARPGKSTGWWLSKGQRGRRAHHELNTTDLGDTRRSEGRLWRQDKPHHPLNSRVKGHAIAQTTAPTGSRCWCNKRGRGGGGRLERSRVCHFPLRHPFQYFPLNDGDNLIPRQLSVSYTALHRPVLPETFAHSFVCCEKYPWKLLCRESKPTDLLQEHRRADIITTAELPHSCELHHVFTDRALPRFKVRKAVTMIRSMEDTEVSWN